MNKAIEVTNLGKKFQRIKDVQRTFKSFALGKFYSKKNSVDFWALRDINFHVEKGETLGIIGANGAGKSTLLSLIAQTTAPTEGKIETNGRMSTLLELGAGFHPDLSGRENVFLNSSILGMTRKETEEKFDEIINLAGIGDAIDSPVKFFSSGMYVRLGFAVAVMCDPDILLMDEILAVGDESFRKKSLSRVEKFKTSGKTMLIVSHDLETIKKMADRVLLLHEGKVLDLGEPLSVVDHYKNFGIYQDGDVTVKEYGTREIQIQNVKFFSNDKAVTDELIGGEPLKIELNLKSTKKIESPIIGFGISDNMGTTLFGTNTQILKRQIPAVDGTVCVQIEIPKLYLQRGTYYFSLAVHSDDHKIQYHRLDNAYKLKVINHSQSEGILFLPCDINAN